MTVRVYSGYNESEILPLYESVGWTAYTDAPETLKKGFEDSLLTLAAFEGDALLGIVRCVGDGHTIVFIQDLLVYPKYQRMGVGTALLQAVLKRFEHVRQIQLATDDAPGNIAFYRKAGLLPASERGCVSFMK